MSEFSLKFTIRDNNETLELWSCIGNGVDISWQMRMKTRN